MRHRSHQLVGPLAVALCATVGSACAETAPYATMVLADRPVAYYRFNEISGVIAADISGNRLDGIYKGDVVLGAKPAYPQLGTAALFGGSKARVHIPRNDTFKFGKADFSIEFWFNCREKMDTRGDILVFKGGGMDFAFFKPVGNTNLLAFASPGRAFQAQTDSLSLGSWHHAVYVRAANVDQWYVDGEISGTATGHVMNIDMNADILIGANHYNNPEEIDEFCLWNGLIDELAFFRTAISAERIQAHFRAAK